MDNHVMYYFDGDSVIELKRCHFCEFYIILSDGIKCLKGYDCDRNECELYSPVGRKGMPFRIAEIKARRNRTQKCAKHSSSNDDKTMAKESTASDTAFVKEEGLQ